MTKNRAYEYCKENYRKKTTPKYVKLQMKQWMRIAEGKDKHWYVSAKKVHQIESILKLLKMPKGLRAGENLYDCSTGYQWLIYIATFCTVSREDPSKRKYETVLLEICRKNYKTYTVATLFIILFIVEPDFSKFFSVAPDGALSREVREAIAETIRSSDSVYEYKQNKRFKILRDYILFKPKNSKYEPLSFSTSRMDGRMPNAFVCDETGALTTNYPIEAMRSGQLNMRNKLGFIISTKYPTLDNPFEDEVSYSKKVLGSIEKDSTRFALLYEPDDTKDWMNDDLVLKQANPAALESKEIWEDLKKKRAYAIAVESARENFVTRHCNIVYQGTGTETYIDVSAVQKCRVNKIDWTGRTVYVGFDLSMTTDNTSVAIVSVDDDNSIIADVVAFVPEGRIQEKSASEKLDYFSLIKNTGKVISCGDTVIDYSAVENFISKIESDYGCRIQAIGFDRYNAISTAQKLENEGYNLVEIKQHSSVLHPATKLLKEKILKGEFKYEKNPLLEVNFQNSKCTYDTNLRLYVNKKRSRGKVDMVVALINAVYLLQQDVVFDDGFLFTIIQ